MMVLLVQEEFSHWAPIAVLVVIAVAFGVGNVVISTLLGPSRQGATKGMVYESGMNPFGSAKRRFNVRFYLVAMTFLLFDVEIVFLIPWAAVFGSLEPGGEMSLLFLGRVLFFILTSILAFGYAWRKGVFRYD
jgi:NADH-quinone oxidoreductase subunit A